MSGAYLLDTNVVIDVLRAPRGSTTTLEPTWPTYVSTLTFAELRFGTAAATGLEQQRRLDDFTHARRTWPHALPVDDAVIDAYGLICTAILQAGARPRTNVTDALLAATALAYDLTLATNNLGDFRHVTTLIHLQPFTPTT